MGLIAIAASQSTIVTANYFTDTYGSLFNPLIKAGSAAITKIPTAAAITKRAFLGTTAALAIAAAALHYYAQPQNGATTENKRSFRNGLKGFCLGLAACTGLTAFGLHQFGA